MFTSNVVCVHMLASKAVPLDGLDREKPQVQSPNEWQRVHSGLAIPGKISNCDPQVKNRPQHVSEAEGGHLLFSEGHKSNSAAAVG